MVTEGITLPSAINTAPERNVMSCFPEDARLPGSGEINTLHVLDGNNTSNGQKCIIGVPRRDCYRT